MSRLNPDITFCFVSGKGTNNTEEDRIMWAQVKGKTEDYLMKLPFVAVHLSRPALMKPKKGLRNIGKDKASISIYSVRSLSWVCVAG